MANCLSIMIPIFKSVEHKVICSCFAPILPELLNVNNLKLVRASKQLLVFWAQKHWLKYWEYSKHTKYGKGFANRKGALWVLSI